MGLFRPKRTLEIEGDPRVLDRMVAWDPSAWALQRQGMGLGDSVRTGSTCPRPKTDPRHAFPRGWMIPGRTGAWWR